MNAKKQDRIHLLHNFPIMIHWIDRNHNYKGCNLETCRNSNEIINTKRFFFKCPILDYTKQCIGVLTFQFPYYSWIEYAMEGINHGFPISVEDPINNANLQFIYENAPVAFWIMDKNGVFMDGNPAAWRGAGVDSAEAFIGKTLADFPSMHDRSLEKIQKINEINAQITKTSAEMFSVENRLPSNIPTFMDQLAWILRPIFDDNRQVIGIAGVSFFNDEQTRNTKFIVPESQITSFMGQRTINFNLE